MAKIGPPFGRVPWNKGLVIGNRCRARKLFLTQLCVQCGAEFQAYPSQRRKYCSPSCRSKMTTVKEQNPNWKGGTSKTLRQADMGRSQYKEWRKSVFVRDGYRCVLCEAGGSLQADHILPYAAYPDLRYELSNGRTLCLNCHRNTDTFAGRTSSSV
jgi:5-methylcytosine-specific restriction endonuclease McrA